MMNRALCNLVSNLVYLIGIIGFSQESQINIGSEASYVELSGKNGGFLDSSQSWNSKMLSKKPITILTYVDPDNEKDNKHVEEELQRKYSNEQLEIFAIINTKSSWLPDFAIKKKLRERQKKNKNLQILIDKNRVIQNEWGLQDGKYHVLLFDKDGFLVFLKSGKLTVNDLEKLKNLIEN